MLLHVVAGELSAANSLTIHVLDWHLPFTRLSANLLSRGITTRKDVSMNYKVVTMKDRFFSGKFDPEKLETMLNSYAGEGWQLKAVTTAEIPGFGNKREEIIFILERP